MMLEIKDLRKKFGKFHALNGLDLHIPQGSLYGFVGPNGAGKTTTIKIMTGLLFADSGKVMIDGVDVSRGLNELKLKIGYVPDFFGVYDNLKVNEYMEFFASCYGIDGLKGRTRYMTLLDQVGLEDKVNFYVDSLSRGMKQRLCLARALIHDPLLLVLDEPASGLDPRTRFEFKEILKELKEQGKTIFISSHVLSELSELCTDIGIIDQGKMILSGSMEEILRRVNASNPLVISVLGNKEKALTILKSQPCVQTIAVKDEDIRVNFIGDEQDEALLLQQLVDAEVLVHGFCREQGSLESLFMQITDHDKEKAVLVHEIESGL
jgi:ABC-2 type transport system ATP-binding protein